MISELFLKYDSYRYNPPHIVIPCFDSAAEFLSLSTSFATFYLGLYLFVRPISDITGNGEVIISVTIFSINLVFFSYATILLYRSVKTYAAENYEHFVETIGHIRSSIVMAFSGQAIEMTATPDADDHDDAQDEHPDGFVTASAVLDRARPLDLIAIVGKRAYGATLPAGHADADQQWSHVGVVVTTELIDITNGQDGVLYVLEAIPRTAGDEPCNVETGTHVFGVQVRELSQVWCICTVVN
jgi:hypothetical protein